MARGNFGERLKRERELREVSQKELTSATRIGPHFLDALENEQWDKLPGGVFNRGFVRAIARYLGLDEEKLLAEYDVARGDSALPVPQPYENKIPRPPLWIPIAMLVGALVVFIGLVAAGVYTWRHFAAKRAAKQSSSSTLLSAPACQASGTMLLDAELPAYETLHFSALQQSAAAVADSSPLLLELNGAAMSPSRHRVPPVQ